jgi:hypothetical protein
MDPQNPTPIIPQEPVPAEPNSSIGPAVGIIVIVALVVLGSLYFLGQRDAQTAPLETQTEESAGDEYIEEMRRQGTSDDLETIEADLNATNFSDLGSEIESVQ